MALLTVVPIPCVQHSLTHPELSVAVEMLSSVALINRALESGDMNTVWKQLSSSVTGLTNIEEENCQRWGTPRGGGLEALVAVPALMCPLSPFLHGHCGSHGVIFFLCLFLFILYFFILKDYSKLADTVSFHSKIEKYVYLKQ